MAGSLVVDTALVGRVSVSRDAVDDLATYTGLSADACLDRLRTYRVEELGTAWRAATPRTPAEMRTFYAAIDHYLWELTLWHASPSYEPYLDALATLGRLQGRGRRALDYGSGIGTAAIRLAELGYEVTIADVPGRTFEYAQHRLRRRGYAFTAIEVREDYPPLDGPYDAIVSFDVLEHVPHPDRVFAHLARALAPRGLVSVVASFDVQDERAGYHLRENFLRWGEGRWNLFMSGSGFRWMDHLIYKRVTGPERWARSAQYQLWRATGLDARPTRVRYLSRVKRPGSDDAAAAAVSVTDNGDE